MTREEAKEIIKNIDYAYRSFRPHEYEALEMAIKALEQEPKTGHWIFCENLTTYWKEVYKCSECNEEITKTGCQNHHSELGKYCSNCGAKMEVR